MPNKKKKTNSVVKPAANAKTVPTQTPTNQSNSNTALWVVVGCLGVTLALVVLVSALFFWSALKFKEEIKQRNLSPVGLGQDSNDKFEVPSKTPQKLPPQAGNSELEDPIQIPKPDDAKDPNLDPYENLSEPVNEADRQIGYIKKVYTKQGKEFLDIDYVQWLSGSAAIPAMREDGACPKKGECMVLNDYYIRNQNPMLRTFEISPEVKVLMQTWDSEKNDIQWDYPISYNQFKGIFTGASKISNRENLKNVPYYVYYENGIITKIAEQYIP